MKKTTYTVDFAGDPYPARFIFSEDFSEGYDKEGTWESPYPNTKEDSFIFGMMEAWTQGEGPMASIIWAYGEPVRVSVVISDAEEDTKL